MPKKAKAAKSRKPRLKVRDLKPPKDAKGGNPIRGFKDHDDIAGLHQLPAVTRKIP